MFQAEDGIRDLVRSRGLGDVYKRQAFDGMFIDDPFARFAKVTVLLSAAAVLVMSQDYICLLYTSDAADERSSVDLGGRRIIKKKKKSRHATRDNRKHCSTMSRT